MSTDGDADNVPLWRLAEIAERHGVDPRSIRTLPGGAANHVYRFGPDLVLRVARSPCAGVDLRKEYAVIAAVRSAGVDTPAVIDFDDPDAPDACDRRGDPRDLESPEASGELDGPAGTGRPERADGADGSTGGRRLPPAMVLERAPGRDMAAAGFTAAAAHRVGTELGAQLARLHRITPDAMAPLPGVPVDASGGGTPRVTVAQLEREGGIDAGTAHRLIIWLDRLDAFRPAAPPMVLLHGDVAPQNFMVVPSAPHLTALLDWGDACWSDPAMEFAKLPLRSVPTVLAAYRVHAPSEEQRDEPGTWEARVLWYHLSWALDRLTAPRPRLGSHWTAPSFSRILDLLDFFAHSSSALWRGPG